MPDPIIRMTGGVIRQQKNTILKNVNIEIKSGEFVYLIGKVGSGKSSFLKTLYAELPLEYGSAEVAGFQLKKIKKSHISLLRRKCGIVFQDFKLLTDRNVRQNLEFVLRATGWKNKKAIQERIETVLEKVGMADKVQKMPHQLSGGEQQRIVLARALLNAPPLILADEPTGNIDPETSYQLVELLKEICATGKTIIIATHQYDLIGKYPGRVFCCENGELLEREQAPAPECVENDNFPEKTALAMETLTEASVEVAEMPALPADVEREETAAVAEQAMDSVVLTETTGFAEDFPQVIPERSQTDDPVSLEPAEKMEEDILALIGKLDYPEITTFDYELDHLPEIKSDEDVSIVTQESASPVYIAGETSETSAVLPMETAEEKPETDDETPKSRPQPPAFDLELID